MKTLAAVAIALSALAASAPGQAGPAPRRLLPVDQAASRPDFFTFRAQLLTALARHDVAALLSVVHPNIKNGFGGDDGKANFEAKWRPAAADSEVWATLAEVLALGGTFESPATFVAPYVSSRWPESVDAFDHVAVVGDRVRIRHRPSQDAADAGSSSFEILRLATEIQDAGESWTAVRLANGTTGYISSRYVRSAVDYRAYFKKEAGRWQMLMLLAGD
jgi:hypothetical protein